MRGVFLHVMADALGSVIVIISALVMWQAPDWRFAIYVDPGIYDFSIRFQVKVKGSLKISVVCITLVIYHVFLF